MVLRSSDGRGERERGLEGGWLGYTLALKMAIRGDGLSIRRE